MVILYFFYNRTILFLSPNKVFALLTVFVLNKKRNKSCMTA